MKTGLKIQSANEGSSLKPIYRLAILAAVMLTAIILIQFVVVMISTPPYEGTVTEWFQLFQSNQIIGLINFELLMVIYMIISVPISLALYLTLKQYNPALMLLYLALSLIGVIAFIASRPALEMLALSNGYAAAPTEVQKSIYLAAGQAKLATFHGTAFHISYILGSLSGVIISYVMWKSQVFSKKTASLRIASSVCDFGLYLPTVGMVISMFSVFFLFAWNILVARRLYQLGQVEAAVEPQRRIEPHIQEIEA